MICPKNISSVEHDMSNLELMATVAAKGYQGFFFHKNSRNYIPIKVVIFFVKNQYLVAHAT